MGVTKVPSIWDYIAGGLDRYQEGAQKRRDNLLQNAGLMTQLYGSGAIDSAELTPALQTAGIKANIKPSKFEKQRSIASSPDINPTTGQPWSDEERALAGLPTKAAKLESEARYKYLSGGPISAREAAALKLPDDDEIATGKELTQEKRFAAIGPRFVDMAIAGAGGVVSPKNVNQVIDSAFNQWASARRAANLPVSPGDRAYFASQAIERMEKQQMYRIQEINANKVSGGGGLGMGDMRMYQRYQSDLKEANDAQEALVRANPMIGRMVAKAQADPSSVWAKDPLVQQFIQNQQVIQTARHNLDLIEYGPSGRSPLGGGAGAGKVRVPGTPTVPSDPAADQMAGAISRGEASIDDARKLYSAGKLTAAQYLRIKQLLGKVDVPTGGR